MKVLYITMLNSDAKNGGYVYRWAIGKTLSRIVGKENLDIITSEVDDSKWQGNVIYKIKKYDSSIEKIKNLFHGNITQISKIDEDFVIRAIRRVKYSYVVFGCSETGNLIKRVKKEKVKTITLYNDIIADSVKRKFQLERKLSYLPIAILEKNAERKDIKYGDIKVALNKRDSETMYYYYKRKADAIIPICLEDSYKERHFLHKDNNLNLLFVGSYNWSANREGILWFCNKVMPYLSDVVKLKIAGFGMEALKKEPVVKNNINIEVIGEFDDISEIYASADIVVAPILTGTGMKTKTAEALMHGKCLLASSEALEGFDGLKETLCQKTQDYIKKINYYIINRPENFCISYRKMYEDNYSVEAMEKKFKKIMIERDSIAR